MKMAQYSELNCGCQGQIENKSHFFTFLSTHGNYTTRSAYIPLF